MLTVIESPEFIECVAKVWSNDERHAFIGWIAANPEAGDMISGSGGLRNARSELVLVTVYTKGRIENIPAHLLRALMERYDV